MFILAYTGGLAACLNTGAQHTNVKEGITKGFLQPDDSVRMERLDATT